MADMTRVYGQLVDRELEDHDVIPYESYHAMLSEVKIAGMPSSYSYIVATDGTTLYHADKSRLGTDVPLDFVKDLVAKINAGQTPEDAVVNYMYNDVKKVASYSILNDNTILVLVVDEDEAYDFQNRITNMSIIFIIIMAIISSICAVIFASAMTKPMGVIKDLINETADFDLASQRRIAKMRKRKDEVGSMAHALFYMRENLKLVVSDITESGNTLTDSVNAVEASSVEIDSMCTDTSATTEELAAGMEETTASTETIQSQIHDMQTGATEIKALSNAGERQALEIKERAENLSEDTKAASKRTTALYADMKAKTESAISDSKAVEQINELTGAIMAISSQTSLLALNANIEAARAGEAGKGFAVVATEIGSLASQTSEAVNNINSIVAVVNEVVSRMANTLTESIDFLENVVQKDYAQFGEVSVQYRDDAILFKDNMTEVEKAMTNLTDKIEIVADSINGIASTISEATVGVTEIAGMTSDITNSTADNRHAVSACLEAVETLRAITAKFKLEG